MKNQSSLKKYAQGVFFLLCLLLSGSAFSQQTLTTVNGWNAYVHLPWDYDAHPDKSYPTIIFIPGLGEVGTNSAALISNGPGAYIKQGWNGNIKVGEDSVKFIIISLQPPSAWPSFPTIDDKLSRLRNSYRMDPSRTHLTGLSMGGWASMCFVTADPMGGPYYYASQIATVVSIEGVQASDNAPWPNKFDNMAIYGGKMLNFEQINDYRKGDLAVARMNNTIPGSASYIKTNYGGGGHCCWEQFYGGNGVEPNKFVIERVSQNIYEWMARNPLSNNGTLPVTLQQFDAQLKDNAVVIDWSTSTEINSNYFEIQRSSNGADFVKVGAQYAKGNSNSMQQYFFRDENPLTGTNLYRLKTVDLDGTYNISKTIAVQIKFANTMSVNALTLNRRTGNLSINIQSSKEETAAVTIADVAGRIYYHAPIHVSSGSNYFSKKISIPATGIYYLRISTENELITKPLFSE